jgi:hypothetical protein
MVDRNLFMLEYIIGYVASDGREIYLPENFCIPVGAPTRCASRAFCSVTPGTVLNIDDEFFTSLR